MGVEWSSDRMTVRPFGSLEIWYCSLGGRTVPCRRVGATAAIRASAVAIAAAQGHGALRTRAADAIRFDYGIRVHGCPAGFLYAGTEVPAPHLPVLTRHIYPVLTPELPKLTPELKFRRHICQCSRQNWSCGVTYAHSTGSGRSSPRRASSASRRRINASSWRRSSGRRRTTAADDTHSRFGIAGYPETTEWESTELGMPV